MMERSSVCGILTGLGVFFTTLCLVSAVHDSNMVEYNGQKLSTFELKKITKEIIPGGHRVRLFLEGTPLPAIYAYEMMELRLDVLKYSTPRQVVPVTVTHNGMVEFNISNYQTYPKALVTFHHRRGMHYMQLNIYRNVSEQVVSHINFTIQGKATFSQGSDVNLQVSVRTPEGENKVLRTAILSDLYTRLASTANVVVPNPVELKFDKKEKTDMQAHLQINASSENAEGLLSITARIDYISRSNCILNVYSIEEQVPIYQEDHRGPFFLDHFVGAPKLKPAVGVDKQHCIHGHKFPCMVRCEFIGDRPKAVQLVRLGPEAGLTPPTLISSAVYDYRAEGWFQVEDLRLGVSKNFQCKAKSCHGETAFNISLTFIQQVKINTETSGLTSFDNGSVVVTCQAEGIPAPRPRLFDEYYFVPLEYVENTNSTTYDIKVTYANNSSEATLHIYEKGTIKSSYIYCRAYQGDYDEDGFSFGITHKYKVY